MCRSTNLQVDPEVWFRIVHLAQVAHSCAPVAAYREQAVEIALGAQGGIRKWQHRQPEATGTFGPGAKRTPARPWLPKTAPGTEDPPNRRTPPKGHRVAGPTGIRPGRQPDRHSPTGEDHPRPGDTDHGHAAPCAGDPGKNSGHARFIPATTDYRASSSPYRRHNPLPRSASGVPQVLDLKRWDSNPHGLPHNLLPPN